MLQIIMDELTEVPIDASGSHFATTTAEARREQPCDTTYRPEAPPVTAAGSRFEPLEIGPNREPQVAALPVTPLKLFQEFVPEWLVKKWIGYTKDTNPSLDVSHGKGQSLTAIANIYS